MSEKPHQKTELDLYLEGLGPLNGAQVAVDTAIPVISARNAVQAASGVKVVGQGALKKIPLLNVPLYAAEAIQNTRDGWGNSIAHQDAVIGDSYEKALLEGLANPVTSIANAASKVPATAVAVKDLATAKSDEEIQQEATAHRERYLKGQRANEVRKSMAQQLLQQSLFRAEPQPRETLAVGDLSGMR